MIIRSQDKEIVLNFNQVVCFRTGKRINKECDVVALYSPFSENDCGFVSLGEYSSKEKAIKVLDMIQEAYCGMRSVDCTTRRMLDTFAKREDVGRLLDLHIDKYFFQMPQDSEVQP